eukprot:1937085-Prymnesium_polylepis.2
MTAYFQTPLRCAHDGSRQTDGIRDITSTVPTTLPVHVGPLTDTVDQARPFGARVPQACRGRKRGSASAARVRSQEERGLITLPSARIGVMNNAIASRTARQPLCQRHRNGKEGLGNGMSKPRNLSFFIRL